MDKIKDRQERNLREEIKSNVEASLHLSLGRIKDLEIENNRLVSSMPYNMLRLESNHGE